MPVTDDLLALLDAQAMAAADAAVRAREIIAAIPPVEPPVEPPPVEPPVEPPPVEPPPVTAWRSGLPWGSGVSFKEGDQNWLQSFGNWRGRKIDVTTGFIGKPYWQGSTDPANWRSNTFLRRIPELEKAGVIAVLTVPLLGEAWAGEFRRVANGEIDTGHTSLAKHIAGLHDPAKPIYLRIGHEANRGYPWSFEGKDAQAYREAWARIARIYLKLVPGAVTVWNNLKYIVEADWQNRYFPGKDVVKLMSCDVYDNNTPRWMDGPEGWRALMTNKGSMGEQFEFAKSQGLKFAFDEWGPTNDDQSPAAGCNNGFFAARLFEWLQENKEHIVYECFFHGASGKHDICPRPAHNAKASDAYLAAWKP